jgi:hypothetical protein
MGNNTEILWAIRWTLMSIYFRFYEEKYLFSCRIRFDWSNEMEGWQVSTGKKFFCCSESESEYTIKTPNITSLSMHSYLTWFLRLKVGISFQMFPFLHFIFKRLGMIYVFMFIIELAISQSSLDSRHMIKLYAL